MGVGQDIQNFQFQQKTKNVKILTSPIACINPNLSPNPNLSFFAFTKHTRAHTYTPLHVLAFKPMT